MRRLVPMRIAYSTRGFTLYELLFVLTLLAVLADIGMVALAAVERRAKAAEAVGGVTTIARGAADYYNASADDLHPSDRRFPISSAHSVPPDAASVRGKLYRSSPNDWAWPPWPDIHFSMPQPQYYAYAFASTGHGSQARANASAVGDLDGNGKTATYTIPVVPDSALHAVPGAVETIAEDE